MDQSIERLLDQAVQAEHLALPIPRMRLKPTLHIRQKYRVMKQSSRRRREIRSPDTDKQVLDIFLKALLLNDRNPSKGLPIGLVPRPHFFGGLLDADEHLLCFDGILLR